MSTLHYQQLIFLALAFLLGLGIGLTSIDQGKSQQYTDMTREGGYEYINPLLSCDISEDTANPRYAPIVEKLKRLVETETKGGNANRVSVYIRDMNTGNWAGVNTDSLYAPASLMKVPLYIALQKTSQVDTTLLQSSVTISKHDDNVREIIKPSFPLIPGRNYTVEDALHAMITDSDNNAALALSTRVPNTVLADVYGDFGLPVIKDEEDNVISPKMYMRLFRILYNASYLWRDKSQQALDLMAHTTFSEGLVAGLPVGTVVSHKYGEREIYTGVNVAPTFVQLHDCGIVYYPRFPYGICVMTEGTNIEKLKLVISHVSTLVYTTINNGSLTK